MDFAKFCDILSSQALKYDPKNFEYPGDQKMWAYTILTRQKWQQTASKNNQQRKKQTMCQSESLVASGRENYEKIVEIQEAKYCKRICGSFQNLTIHLDLFKYWHSALNHGISMAIIVVYDMYLECINGSVCPE